MGVRRANPVFPDPFDLLVRFGWWLDFAERCRRMAEAEVEVFVEMVRRFPWRRFRMVLVDREVVGVCRRW